MAEGGADESSELTHVKGNENIDNKNEEQPKTPQLTIMVIGKTGVGKTRLIFSLLDKKVANTLGSALPIKYSTIVEYTGTVYGIPVTFYDTIGLGDLELKDKVLMTEFKKKMSECRDRFIVLICQRFTDRFDDSVKQFAKLLGRYFKNDYTIWKNCILVLTHADIYRLENCDDDDDEEEGFSHELKMKIHMQEWARKFELTLKKHNVPEAIIMNMPVCAAGIKKNIAIHITNNWMKTLMATCLERQQGFQSAYRMKRQSIQTAVCLSVAAESAFGAVAIPVVGIPIGALIGALVGINISNDTSEKVIHDKERKKFHDKKIEELTKTKEEDQDIKHPVEKGKLIKLRL